MNKRPCLYSSSLNPIFLKSIFGLFCLLFFSSGSVASLATSTKFAPRKNYGARLEMENKVFHGAGQDPKGFLNYFNAMPYGNKPVIYKAYIGLDNSLDPFFNRLKKELESYNSEHGVYLIPEIGLAMGHDGDPSAHYEQDVAAGLYDEKIEQFCQELAQLGHPVFIRIGFEFNGLGWNGYKPNGYKKAFIRITKAIRAHNLDAATVWCAAIPLNNGTYDYKKYYPGDEYVDWWGIDLFDKEDFSKRETHRFMDEADKHSKPVMLGEVTPRFVGVDNGQTDWDAWFEPYFKFIQEQAGVKAFGYINWKWSEYPQWENWGDARIESNSQVLSNYIYKSKSNLYFHGQGEKGYRQLQNGSDSVPPSQVSGLSAVFNDSVVELNWTKSSDNKSLIRYEIFKGNQYLASSTDINFRDRNIMAGSSPQYLVRAVDSNANRGVFSTPVSVLVPGVLNKITNREFDNGLYQWRTESSAGGKISSKVDNSSKLSGKNSVKLKVEAVTGTNWHLQFKQPFSSHQGKSYSLSFSALADGPAEMDIFFQQTHPPYDSILMKTIHLSKDPQDFVFTNTGIAVEDNLVLTFMLGKMKRRRTVWLDNIQVTEK